MLQGNNRSEMYNTEIHYQSAKDLDCMLHSSLRIQKKRKV